MINVDKTIGDRDSNYVSDCRIVFDRRSKSLPGPIIAVVALILNWLLFFDSVRLDWQLNPQYGFGWVVPFLGAALFWRRWVEKPPGHEPARRLPVALISVALIASFLPFRLLSVANPEWRLLYWAQGIQAIALTECLLFCLGGVAWVRFFAAPLIFVLIAAPWPMAIETAIIQNLGRFVASLTVETAGLFNIPAVQRGNLIEVGSGIVGIDEACSGIYSLQSAFMISLFLGEQRRLNVPRRLALIFGSFVFVILANLGRTTFLVWVAARKGMGEMEKWHDSAGIMVMAFVLGCALLLAWKMNPEKSTIAAGQTLSPTWPGWLPKWIGSAIILWVIFTVGLTEFWYRLHEARSIPNVRWSVKWPIESENFKTATIPEKSLGMLRCSSYKAASWRDEGGNSWSAFLLRWEPGRNSAQLAKGHSPEVCFPAAGLKASEQFGNVRVSVDRVDLSFKHQTFETGTRILHVFYCLWTDVAFAQGKDGFEDGSQTSRIRAAWDGIRNPGQQALEVVVEGPESAQEAATVLIERLPKLIQAVN